MKYRPHYGSFDTACSYLMHIEPNREALAIAIREAYRPWSLPFEPSDLVIEEYGFDSREPWNDHCFIVHIPAKVGLSVAEKRTATVGVLGYISEAIP